MPDSMTQVLSSGPPGAKVNIAVLGDGFTAGEQAVYDDKVQELLLDGVFTHDYFYEDAQAFNVYRVNLVSAESGVTRLVYKEAGAGRQQAAPVTPVDTALGWVYTAQATTAGSRPGRARRPPCGACWTPGCPTTTSSWWS